MGVDFRSNSDGSDSMGFDFDYFMCLLVSFKLANYLIRALFVYMWTLCTKLICERPFLHVYHEKLGVIVYVFF